MRRKTIDKSVIVKPCFAYPGGKTRLLDQILPLIPDHARYVEPFAGGLAVLLGKPCAKLEVINDLDYEVANFYRYVRYHFDALVTELGTYLSSREDFELLLKNPGYTDLQRACRWYLLKVMSFGGMSGTFGRAVDGFTGFDRDRHIEKIRAVASRLNRVVIESQDWEEVVKFYDKPDSFHFFDPPYVDCGKTAYNPFSEFDMERVRTRLDNLKGNWILTCDDSDACRRIFKGLPVQRTKIKYSTGNTRKGKGPKTRKTFGELIVIDPRIAPRSAKAA